MAMAEIGQGQVGSSAGRHVSLQLRVGVQQCRYVWLQVRDRWATAQACLVTGQGQVGSSSGMSGYRSGTGGQQLTHVWLQVRDRWQQCRHVWLHVWLQVRDRRVSLLRTCGYAV